MGSGRSVTRCAFRTLWRRGTQRAPPRRPSSARPEAAAGPSTLCGVPCCRQTSPCAAGNSPDGAAPCPVEKHVKSAARADAFIGDATRASSRFVPAPCGAQRLFDSLLPSEPSRYGAASTRLLSTAAALCASSSLAVFRAPPKSLLTALHAASGRWEPRYSRGRQGSHRAVVPTSACVPRPSSSLKIPLAFPSFSAASSPAAALPFSAPPRSSFRRPHQHRLRRHSPAQDDVPELRYPLLASLLPSSIFPRAAAFLDLSRFHAPIGYWLLFWPCAHSAALAAPASVYSPTYALASSAYSRAQEDGTTVQQLLQASFRQAPGSAAEAPPAGEESALESASQISSSSLPSGGAGRLQLSGEELVAPQFTALVPLDALWLDTAKWVGLCWVGAVLMRSAGCIVNDLLDRKLDARVERTRSRPLPSGRLSPQAALASLSVHLGLSLALLLQFNPATVVTALASVGLVAVYPLMKRVTHWPQLVLGLTFNWGALVGWTAVTGQLGLPEASGAASQGASAGHFSALSSDCAGAQSSSDGCSGSGDSSAFGGLGKGVAPSLAAMSSFCSLGLTPLFLYASGIFWTLTYDTIYAHQDKRDDRRVGIKSTALLFGSRTPLWTAGFSAAYAACLLGAGLSSQMAWPYYASTALCCLQLLVQSTTTNLNDPKACSDAFKRNQWVGATLFVGILASKLVENSRKQSTEGLEKETSDTCAGSLSGP
ncbi:4-hydroxybenzoate polyprenyl transferase [Besnoitia besnoiti]|uniref:4-hydroxybenzoate polyprenyltransferase, mitochondrial n=1 Tax=Besnoitia besnoiti TaxID=94643 RepID=A0A2A9MN56_BESBE|nr:4-hydroxybenzoate polyprenyl transferase [Besnoitia besnoiti]PFH37931.1 4-hydroxybenzoate polyprenyl transferase [Besnoitia besnoiti]